MLERLSTLILMGCLVWGAVGFAAGNTNLLPGAEPFPDSLQTQLTQALQAKGAEYVPRTHHLYPDGRPQYTNRLIREPSPYLLQHAHNPLNWYPWGDEAFARAKKENKPILLSIGYSTCHWCHVMERESFEDVEIATYLNQHYIAVKVDREQRPDIDGVYMAAVQMMTGRGGWPMTVWLTPDRKPFYGGTYFPPRDGVRGAKTGFLTLLTRLSQVYSQDPERITQVSTQLTQAVRTSLAPSARQQGPDVTGVAGVTVLKKAAESFKKNFDAAYGGFGQAPKFPRSVVLEFLLRYSRRTGDQAVRDMVVKTLEAMAAGGMYDHIGGGFHRYATDRQWLVPHFEKMLYDNALLTLAYLEAFQLTGRAEFAQVARDILTYVEREMTTPQGGFYSATDADSEGEEGTFFVWTPADIRAVLDPEVAKLMLAYYGVTEKGNFGGKTILHVTRSLADVAKELGFAPEQAEQMRQAARAKLYAARLTRIPPHKDKKIVVSWNGLMIAAFARAAHVLNVRAYAQQAARGADFILTHLKKKQQLQRSALDGVVSGAAYLDDYAFLAAGLLDLYEASFEARWLREAIALHDTLTNDFWDAQAGGFFMTARTEETLLGREKPYYDGAEPSGNSVAIQSLFRLAELTTQERYRQQAEQGLRAFAQQLDQSPSSVPRLLASVDFAQDTPKEIIIIKPNREITAEPLLAKLRTSFVPNRVLAVVAEGRDLTQQQELIPLLEFKKSLKGKVTAYVCEKQVCLLPTSDPEVFAKQIAQVKPLSGMP